MKSKILIVQPHSDDALFSASHLFFSGDSDVRVLTIENNKKRIAEDEKLYDFLTIPYHHLEVEFDDQSFYDYHKRYPSVTVDDSEAFLKEFFTEKVLEEIRKEIVSYISKFKKKNPGYKILIPWGVGHPFHIFVRNVIENVIDKKSLLYYRDFPHSFKRRAQQQVAEQLNNYELVYSADISSFADVKWGLAKKYYKSQSGLLWFEQGYIRKNLNEEIYKQK